MDVNELYQTRMPFTRAASTSSSTSPGGNGGSYVEGTRFNPNIEVVDSGRLKPGERLGGSTDWERPGSTADSVGKARLPRRTRLPPFCVSDDGNVP